MEGNGKAGALDGELFVLENGLNSRVAMENRLEVLRVLSNSILEEVESLKRTSNLSEPGHIDLESELQHFEIDLIRCALLRTGGNQRQAGLLLNVKATTLNAKIKRYSISLNGLDQIGPVDEQFRRWNH
jgi:transcriptional regulator with PAS, ATPase and Fis domain